MKRLLLQLRSGIIDQNPTLVLLLGMCPALATSTSVINALSMGVAVMAVLICSNVVISALRRVIPAPIRIACNVVLVSGFVTAADMLLQAYIPALSASLGLFVPLIVVNCIILARAEAFASKNGVLLSAIDGLSSGLGFTLALCIVAAIREILGNGTFLGVPVLGASYEPAMILILPPGGFLVLGLVIAAVQKIRKKVGAS